jgi:hypothetical protein
VFDSGGGRSRQDRALGYRQLTGDTRKWGSPWNIFLDPSACAKMVRADRKAWIVNGELIEPT